MVTNILYTIMVNVIVNFCSHQGNYSKEMYFKSPSASKNNNVSFVRINTPADWCTREKKKKNLIPSYIPSVSKINFFLYIVFELMRLIAMILAGNMLTSAYSRMVRVMFPVGRARKKSLYSTFPIHPHWAEGQ